jgi:hypothetical protein
MKISGVYNQTSSRIKRYPPVDMDTQDARY